MIDRSWLIETFLKKDKKEIVGKPESNWRYKVYPKPRLWISEETLKYKKKYDKECSRKSKKR